MGRRAPGRPAWISSSSSSSSPYDFKFCLPRRQGQKKALLAQAVLSKDCNEETNLQQILSISAAGLKLLDPDSCSHFS